MSIKIFPLKQETVTFTRDRQVVTANNRIRLRNVLKVPIANVEFLHVLTVNVSVCVNMQVEVFTEGNFYATRDGALVRWIYK